MGIKIFMRKVLLVMILSLLGGHAYPQEKALRGPYLSYPAMQQLITRLEKQGFDRHRLQQIFASIQRDENILAKVRSPAEAKPWYAYRPIFMTKKRVEGGVRFWQQYQPALQAASRIYKVPAEYIVAIIGVETFYGQHTGKHNVLRSLTTLAMDYPERSTFYTRELEQYMNLIREEKLNNPSLLKGSYAGAMGLGQFISSSYRHYGVDFNGDGHKDLWHPEDAIGSVANYFSKHGWKSGEGVAVPARIKGQFYGKIAVTQADKPLFSLRQLEQYGVKPALSLKSARVGLLKLQASQGDEYWVTGDNFYAITRYNHSPKYAMVVHQLAQAILDKKQRQK